MSSQLAAAIASTLPQLRAEADSLMIDTATIERKTGETTIDPGNGQRIDVWELIATTPVRVIRRTVESLTVEAAGQQLDLRHVELRMPHATDVRTEDRVTLTATGDALLLGVPIAITVVEAVTHPVQRRARGVADADRQQ